MQVPLLAGAYEGISVDTSSQEAINFYYEKAPPREDHDGAMLPLHGASLFATAPNTGETRGFLFDPGDDLLYAVIDDDFYEIKSDGTITDRGNLNTSSGHVQMALNPSSGEILIVDGTNGYIYDISTTTLTAIADADYPDTADTCAYIDGRFLVNDPTTPGRFWWSDLNDGTSWDSLSFSTAQTIKGPIKSILVDRRIVWLFGESTAEPWYHVGDADFVFQRFEVLDNGTCARMTPQKFDNSVVWLSRTERGELQVVRAGEAYQPVVISTPQLSRKMHRLDAVEDAFAYTYQIDGHEFYVLTFPTGGATWAYDATTQEWHQRSGAFDNDGLPTREPINAMVFCDSWGGHIAGDYQATGKLWAIQEDIYTFDSNAMERRITGPQLRAPNEPRLRFAELQVDIETGVAQAGDTGSDRTVEVSWSKNGGQTYSVPISLDIGTENAAGFKHRLMKRKLGYGRSWIFSLYTKSTRKIVVKGAYGRLVQEPFLKGQN